MSGVGGRERGRWGGWLDGRRIGRGMEDWEGRVTIGKGGE